MHELALILMFGLICAAIWFCWPLGLGMLFATLCMLDGA
jgi:hypothetical protein